MGKEELAKIAEGLLKDELIAKSIERKGNVIVITFLSGAIRTVTIS